MFGVGLINLVKETLVDAGQIIVSRQGARSLYRVSLYRNAVYLIINSAVNSLTGVVFWIVAARLYDPGAVGLASAAISASGFVVLFASMGLDFGVIRFLPDDNEKARDIVNSCITLVGLAALVLSGIFIAGLAIWSPALLPIQKSPVLLASFLSISFVFTISGLVFQVFVARRRAGFTLVQGLVFGLTKFIPLLLLASIYTGSGIYISWSIALALSTLIGLFWFMPRVIGGYGFRFRLKREALARMFKFSLANYVTSILWALPVVVLPLIVVNVLGTEQNAYYYIGWSVVSVIFIIPYSTSQALFAEGSHRPENLAQEVKKSLKISLVLIVPALLFLLLLGDKLLWLFGRHYSENAVKLIWIISPSVFPLTVNYIYLGIKRVQGKMTNAVLLTALLTILILGMSYLLLHALGIIGAGIAWLSGQSMVALFVIYELLLHKPARGAGET
jgi:O-antigen/teichoic acid export membrane protein